MTRKLIGAGAMVLIEASLTATAEIDSIPWDMKALSVAPKVYEDPSRSKNAVNAIFYEGLPFEGNPTRVFAYYGIPKTDGNGKVPAMVLVHGGGGSAFAEWVELWVGRGYAAIAMDTCGCVGDGGHMDHPRHEHGGPQGWGGFHRIEAPIRDQWTYHAVADVILAHSLIRSFPEVDPDRIGLTGISWGGYLTCIAVAVDRRFKFAAPVYGCGFLGDNSAWLGEFKKMGTEKSREWLGLWDPSVYLSSTQVPMLWVTGTNDFAFPMDSLQKSYRLSGSPGTLCVQIDMPHAQGPGMNPKEIHAMADALLKNGIGLAKITKQRRHDLDVWVEFESNEPIARAELNYTADTGEWQKRKWAAIKADVDANRKLVSARLPENAKVFFFNITDRRGLVVSSEYQVTTPNISNADDGK